MADAADSASLSRPGPARAGTEEGAHLDLIAEMTQDFAGSLDVEATLDRALDVITRHLEAEAGSIFLLDPEQDELVCRASCGPVDLRGMRLAGNQGVVGDTVYRNACALVRDVQADPHFDAAVDAQTGFQTRSILCASLSVRDRSLGAIELLNKKGGDGLFDEQDRRVLRTLAAAAGLAVQNARLTASLMEQERVRRELELAAEIQRNLLPAERPDAFPVHGLNLPARGVSGDFYDFLELPGGRVGFAIGDVSGKGMNAALLMAKTASLYRCLARDGLRPGALLARLDAELAETATRGMFVTLVVGELDTARGQVCLANAGHEPPLLRHPDGRFEAIPADAPPAGLGAVATEGLEVERHLDGGSLALFTDGLTEAPVEGRQLGAAGVQALLERHAGLPPTRRLQAVTAPVRAEALRDDITLLLVEDGAGGGRP